MRQPAAAGLDEPAAGHGMSGAGTARNLYVRMSDPEALTPGPEWIAAIRAELRRGVADATDLPAPGDPEQRSVAAWARMQADRHLGVLAEARTEQARAVLVRRAALGCAPLALASGAWLQWLSAPGNADDPLVLRILALYASDVGAGHPRASRGNTYLGVLRQLRLADHAVPAARLAADQRIPDEAFYLPALLLAMSRRPEEFRPEILGADLCLRSVGLLPPLRIVHAVHPTVEDWTVLDPGRGRELGRSAAELCRGAVDTLRDAHGEGERLGLGFAWAAATLRRSNDQAYADLVAALDPAFEMAELLRLRAWEAAVYHQSFLLQGRSLSDWLRQSRTDPTGLMRALASSRLVKPGRSEASSLVRGLISERGPMFRVFAPADLAVIKRWIDSLPLAITTTSHEPASAEPAPIESTVDKSANRLASLSTTPAGDDTTQVAPMGLRDAYHQLLNRTDSPALRHYALRYVYGWLGRARYRIDRDEHPLPARWGSEGLRPWLRDQHDRHASEFEASAEVPLPSRDELIDSTVQLAPLTLIDGAWLQGFTDYEHASSEVGRFLFETYWDELGNGEPALNHPLIYREVLAEMGVVVPPTASVEFAHWDGFRDSSFELPVYWLCIGRLPRTFLPEVLGLNLAMELSGVGGTYRRARIALKTYGFSSRFVDIHNTIDNVSTGHSAWAADAVDTHLAAMRMTQGAGAQHAVWNRIRAGYRSLNPPMGFWARQAGRRAQAAGARR